MQKNKYCEFSTSCCPINVGSLNVENRIFAAYSSHDKKISNIIETGISELNQEVGIPKWITWKNDMDIENSMIFCEICKNIFTSRAILVELSDLNFNVLFEYGYSFGLNKKIYPTVNNDFDYDDIDRFINPLLGIGIAKYDRNKFAQKLLRKQFWEKDNVNTILSFAQDDILDDSTNIEANCILYIKNIDKQEVSEKIESELIRSKINVIYDDFHEEVNNLVWYFKQIKKSFAVIIDLGMSHSGHDLNHYLKCAFVAGLSVSTGRRTLILNSVHSKKPSDLISITKQYSNAKDAKKIVAKFIELHSGTLSVINSYLFTKNNSKQSIFDKIDLGEHVAENDQLFLKKYFVETPEYNKLLKTGYKLIIGRKGTGKSASFQRLSTLYGSSNSLVISELFSQYNLDDIYNLTLDVKNDNDKNKVVIAFWKFVLFLAIAKDIYYNKLNKGNQIDIEDCELDLLDYCEKLDLLNEEKSITDILKDIISEIKENENDVKSLQGLFYSKEILILKDLVSKYLIKNNISLYLNIDGIDSNLSINNNSELVSLIIYNLHEVCVHLFNINYSDYSINLFMREDIYDTIKDQITQKDKINKIFIRWDTELLMRMITERLNGNGIGSINDILSDELNVKSFMVKLEKYIYSRPRDYVFIFNLFIQIARSQKIDKINNKIFSEALSYYSIHVYESLEAELLSLPFKFKLGDFLNTVKHNVNDKNKISIELLKDIINKMGIIEKNENMIISFFLKVEVLYYMENNSAVKWSTLIDPETKLKIIFAESLERRFFIFHPIIEYVMEKRC